MAMGVAATLEAIAAAFPGYEMPEECRKLIEKVK